MFRSCKQKSKNGRQMIISATFKVILFKTKTCDQIMFKL